MKTLCGIAVLGLVVLLTGAASAWAAVAAEDGNHLLEECRALFEAVEEAEPTILSTAQALYCRGLLQGIIAMNFHYEGQMDKSRLAFCVPDEGIRPQQAARIIVRYLQQHPQTLHYPGYFLAVQAFREAFPCAPAASRPQK